MEAEGKRSCHGPLRLLGMSGSLPGRRDKGSPPLESGERIKLLGDTFGTFTGKLAGYPAPSTPHPSAFLP